MNTFTSGLAELISDSIFQEASLFLLRTVPGFPPIIQTVHILGIAVVMGSIVMLNLRVLGLAVPSQNISEMTQRLMPWLWSALVINAISGSVFLFARPNRYLNNPVFGWKFTFLIPAILLTLFFHYMSRQQPDFWNSSRQRALTAKIIALLSLVLWIMVPMAGRWIAYSEYIYFPAENF
ncbi:MAG: hypothetical protein JKY98_09295 [Gammaproteobacteria bacterium]|nr:hypothetical protein [Gammaproteobacteria bacterium]